jgi:hypothetical protein
LNEIQIKFKYEWIETDDLTKYQALNLINENEIKRKDKFKINILKNNTLWNV